MPRLSKARKELLTTMMKETIFEATTSVLCEHGVDGTTMNRVAEAASLSKSSLYDYFQSKEDLLAFVSDRIVGPFLKMLEELIPARLPAPQKLEAILRHALEESTRHRAIFRLLEQSGQNQQVKRSTRPRILEAFTAIFEQGIQEGLFQPHNPAHTGRMFAGCLSELFELQTSSASNEAATEYVAVLIEAVRHGFSIHVASGPGPDTTSPGMPNP
jgi:TetR/AcrR family transcriptional regulator, cholesterol catabolism regulator